MLAESELRTDVLVIGAGAAGLRAAIELAGQGISVLVISKRAHDDAHTRWAAGGINAALGSLDPEDRWDLHAADTVREGHDICDPVAVERLAREAPARVLELQAWGCPFDVTEDGRINQRYFGAQSFRRTCFVGDRTGDAILRTLVDKARSFGIAHRDRVFVTGLLNGEDGLAAVAGYDMRSGRPLVFRAAAVVLAGGGYAAAYRPNTSRPDENTGDAVALAYQAGAVLRDMEFVQFHPTGMIKPAEMRGRLVSEAMRGEGAHLTNRAGERFMARYSPDRLELDARDVVARAIYQEIQEGRGTPDRGVWLDISHRPPQYIRERLPKLHRQFLEQGVDLTRDAVEVAPSAHYAMGGVKVDFATGATSVRRLFAVGEASAGLHGANRLGGNSLAETVVFGRMTGAHLAEMVSRERTLPPPVPDAVRAHFEWLDALRQCGGPDDPHVLIAELGRILWDHAGIVRTGDGCWEGLERVQALGRRARRVSAGDVRSARFEATLDLRWMLLVGEAILRGAILREESRGAHFRRDCPEPASAWRRNVLAAKDDAGEMRLWTEAVGEVPPEVQTALEESRMLDYHHLE